ncbi:MAG: hypothetical protein HY840_15140 [Bacteroidetes bacterium]|nr:hypothetical protein [Bacteroidota bacterium]
MSKPIHEITIGTMEKKTNQVNTLFDTGSFYTIVREDVLPETKFVYWYPVPDEFKTAVKGGKLQIKGVTRLTIEYNNRKIVEGDILISSDINREMIIGAKTMQAWDIVINNKNGKTTVTFGKDMRDPEITEVD